MPLEYTSLLLKQKVHVKLDNQGQQTIQEYLSKDIKIIKNAHNDDEIEKIDEEILKRLED